VLAPLGAGGMGEVYRARDTRLDRAVALKILPSDMVADAARLERFSREARTLASLNHPHIVTIYSTEEADGVRFLTMELVEGRPLNEVIQTGGLSISAFFALAIPLTDALSAAHEKHVTHRDLKPANVMVSHDGRVKVLDFGLASVNDPGREPNDATRIELTHQGTVLGTVPYMSPEQVEGKPLDHRTDIFSLGIVLYEMASGARPFQGDSSPALMSSILKDAPPPLRDVRPDLPGQLGRLIARCLEKQPRARVQTAREVFNELNALVRTLDSGARAHLAPGANATETFSIGVAAFEAKAGAANDFADGLRDAIVTGLARFSYLRLVTRPSGDGDTAGAAYLLEGSVRAAGDIVRVAVRLVERATGTNIWVETYDRSVTETPHFDLQDQLADLIVSCVADVNGALIRRMAAAVRAKPIHELSAYEAVVRRLAYVNVLSPEEHAAVRSGLERAVELAPAYADAWASLAYLYLEEHAQGFNPQPNALDRARTAARRALAIDSANQLGFQALALLNDFSGEHGAFRAAADRAIALNPLDTYTLSFLGALIAYSGDWDAGLALCERAIRLNPYHPGVYWLPLMADHYRRGDYAGALQILDRVNMPGYPPALVMRAAVYGQLGRVADARAVWNEAAAMMPDIAAHMQEANSKWFAPDLVAHILDGLRKAGAHV
jgi:TolB-like protein/Tfp pilus assembly protein PilF